ncbi:hypothetical protein [Dokdonella soli]
MKKPVIALAAIVAAMSSAAALAQNAPLRGVGLLALDASESHSGSGGRSALVEIPDDNSGGGSIGARALRGGDGSAPHAAHEAGGLELSPPKTLIQAGDPAQPAAATPKRPSYRWQSLVPGAIK